MSNPNMGPSIREGRHSPSPSDFGTDDAGKDLEKQTTATDDHQPQRTSGTARISRTQSLTRRATYRGRFTHPLAHVRTSEEQIVDFEGEDDPYRPRNWPFRKKVVTTLLYGLTTMGSTWASSVYSPAIGQVTSRFHVGEEVGLLGLSLLLMGFGLGPLFWAPLSEV